MESTGVAMSEVIGQVISHCCSPFTASKPPSKNSLKMNFVCKIMLVAV